MQQIQMNLHQKIFEDAVNQCYKICMIQPLTSNTTSARDALKPASFPSTLTTPQQTCLTNCFLKFQESRTIAGELIAQKLLPKQ